MTPRVAFTILLLLHVHVVCDIKTKAKIKQAAIYFLRYSELQYVCVQICEL